jgi:hypothetical protein
MSIKNGNQRYTKTMKIIRKNTKIIGQTKIAPIICFQGGKKLGKILVKATIPEKINTKTR